MITIILLCASAACVDKLTGDCPCVNVTAIYDYINYHINNINKDIGNINAAIRHILKSLLVLAVYIGIILGIMFGLFAVYIIDKYKVFDKCLKLFKKNKSTINDPILGDDSQATQLYTQ